MMINQNKAVAFYGQRPMLASQLPSHISGRNYRDLGALQAVGQLYMPASAGSKAIGGIMDKFIGMGMSVVKTAFPALGEVLSFVGDIVDFILTPMGNLMEAMAIGACTYLEEPQAQAILKDMEDNRTEYIKDSFMDCLYAFYRRVGATGNAVQNIKQGRSAVIQGVMGGVIDTFGIGRNAERVAHRVYVKAMAAGAKDWQAAAAVCYGGLAGFQTKGFPSGFSIKVAGVSVATVQSGVDTSKAMWPLGNDFDAAYYSKLGTPILHNFQWIDEKYKAKSGGVIGDTKDKIGKGGGGGGAVPLLALAAAAFLAFKK